MSILSEPRDEDHALDAPGAILSHHACDARRSSRHISSSAAPGSAGRVMRRPAVHPTCPTSPRRAACDTLLAVQVLAEDWRIKYNTYRPHGSLDGLTPEAFRQRWINNRGKPTPS
ncbi:integrase core domain-containing protein [Micromonospora kangleipakensis]|uniref:integrase core domain-containing protein n=1 Tax=Micromonospora kangleipakensis TaxID=1077942 RepID=UPI003BF8A9D0